MRTIAGLIVAAALAITGCAGKPVNPTFQLTHCEARQALAEMEREPRPLQRPVVVIGGYMDPNVSPPYIKWQLRQATGDQRIVGVVVGFYSSFDDCRRKVIEAVDAAFPSDDPEWTTEVDVVGLSLGGLVGRHAAAPSRDPEHPRRLKIARLFTVASPHSGAALAKLGSLNQLHTDLRPGSELMRYLEACDASAGYELYPYARLRDHLVGTRYSAPPGKTPLWLAPPPFEGGHAGAWHDNRFIADIARRLRGEEPFSSVPGAPLPEKG